MAPKKLVYPLNKRRLPRSAGNKALSLHKLWKIGVRIPVTFVCDWKAYHCYQAEDPDLVERLKEELSRFIQPEKTYAVRSSANLEDSLEFSFAGQFKSVLHVQGVNNLLLAIWSVWSSARTPSVDAYLARHDLENNEIAMAVIIQEMVNPLYSGVALSKNPVTGGDEVIVEAVEGEGILLMQTGLTPERWVNKWGYWREKPVLSAIPFNLIEQVVEKTREMASRLGTSVDLEWVYDGQDLYWVQVREITALNQPNIYSHHIPREFLPGMIKPLIYSVNIPLVNGVWIRWIGEITGDIGIHPEELTKAFYYRAYFNMGVLGDIFKGLGFPGESVEMLMGILPPGAGRPRFRPSLKTFSRAPWLAAFLVDKWMFGPKMRRALHALEPRLKATSIKDLDSWKAQDLLVALDRHFVLIQELAYYNVLGPLLMMTYNQVLKRMLAKCGVDINTFDLTENMPELRLFSPTTQLGVLKREFSSFPLEIQERIRALPLAELGNIPGVEDFARRVTDLVEQFGHLSNSGNDFSARPWRESPEMVLGMVMEVEPPREEPGQKVRMADLEKQRKAGSVLKLIHRRAREFRLLRERVSGLYTLGYGFFRYYYLALGRHFVRQGLLEAPEDIYYLTNAQVHAIVNGEKSSADLSDQVNRHKADMQRFEDIQLPTVIYGDVQPQIQEESTQALVGVSTSLGCYTGKVRVIHGLEDFLKMKPGEVLVIPFSEISWTPLFAYAGAVVAESGGLLSHSSIVAREYNIPAVVSVEGATRLPDGTLVTVDAYKGEVFIHDQGDGRSSPDPG